MGNRKVYTRRMFSFSVYERTKKLLESYWGHKNAAVRARKWKIPPLLLTPPFPHEPGHGL